MACQDGHTGSHILVQFLRGKSNIHLVETIYFMERDPEVSHRDVCKRVRLETAYILDQHPITHPEVVRLSA
jgi:hypothetical protein